MFKTLLAAAASAVVLAAAPTAKAADPNIIGAVQYVHSGAVGFQFEVNGIFYGFLNTEPSYFGNVGIIVSAQSIGFQADSDHTHDVPCNPSICNGQSKVQRAYNFNRGVMMQ